MQELKFFYKYQHNLLPSYLSSLPFEENSRTHDHNTRQQNDVHQPFVKHEFAKCSIRFDIPKLINATPAAILEKINTHSLKGFSWYVKQYIIRNYEDTCTIDNCYICSRT